MSWKHPHLREKALELRTKQQMTLDEICERLSLPKTTVYYWIKDLPIPETQRQTERRLNASRINSERAAAKRQAAYDQGWAEAPDLLQDLTFRDFVVLYMAEGTKRHRNEVAFVNSDPAMVMLANRWMKHFTTRAVGYWIQYHVDQDVDELKHYWGQKVNAEPESIKVLRKSNSNQLSGRQWRSVYGLLTIRTGDTYFRARLQAWMDFVKSQW